MALLDRQRQQRNQLSQKMSGEELPDEVDSIQRVERMTVKTAGVADDDLRRPEEYAQPEPSDLGEAVGS